MELLKKFYMADPADNAGASSENINNTQKLKDTFVEIKDTLKSISFILSHDINDQIDNWDTVSKKIAQSTTKDLVKGLEAARKVVGESEAIQQNVGKKLLSQSKIESQIEKLKNSQLNINSSLASLEAQGVESDLKREELTAQITEDIQRQLDILNNQLKTAKENERALGRTGQIMQSFTKIPIVGQLLDAKRATEAMEKAAAENNSRWKVFQVGIKEMGASLKESLTDPLVIAAGAFKLITSAISGIISLFKTAIQFGLKFDQNTFDIAKNVGVTVNEASILQKQFVDMANSSQSLGISSSQLAKNYAEISNSLGFMAPSNKEFLETATLIQKRLGASAEDMSALTLQSTLSGKTLEETMSTLNVSRNIEGARNRLLLSQKQILDGIAKTSAAVLINFKGDVGALGDAIVRATKLGTTLDTINKQGETLLDFESSISKEFEAQLLTGRDINLTRAREFALAGDTKNLMEELNRQGATYQQFMGENVIARQAEAAAVGLSVEEYSKILLKQQQSNRLGVQQGQSLEDRYGELMKTVEGQKLITEQLTEQERIDLKKASIQDKFQSAIEKLQDTLGSIVAGPLAQLVDDITKFLSKSENVKSIANGIKSIFKGIASAIQHLPQILGVAIEAMKILASITAVQAAAAVTAGSAYAGPAALGIGIATYGALTALMGGTGLGKYNFAGGEGESMTEPINPNVTAANSQAAAANAEQRPIALTFHHTTEVGAEKITAPVVKEIIKTPGYGNSTK